MLNVLQLLFPKACNGCRAKLLTNEHILCAQCRHHLPLACFHRTGNPIMKNSFYGRIPVENATALFQFQKKGITQEIMHNLKYKGQKEISHFFGQWLGTELASHPDYKTIDMVIPVPLHKKKLQKRGYNQVSGFGLEIAQMLQVAFREDLLLKESATTTQVFKKRTARYTEASVFVLKQPDLLENKHVLLVDDIVTTGATLEKCAQQLLMAQGVKLSIATMAIA